MEKYQYAIVVCARQEQSVNELEKTFESIENQAFIMDEICVILYTDQTEKYDEIFHLFSSKYKTSFIICKNETVDVVNHSFFNHLSCDYIAVIDSGTEFSPYCIQEVDACFNKMKGSTDVIALPIDPTDGEDTAYKFHNETARFYHLKDKFRVIPTDFNCIFMKYTIFKDHITSFRKENTYANFIKILKGFSTIGFASNDKTVSVKKTENGHIRHGDFSRRLDELKCYIDEILIEIGYMPFFVQYIILREFVYLLNHSEDYKNCYMADNNIYTSVWEKASNFLSMIDDTVIMNYPTAKLKKAFIMNCKYRGSFHLDPYAGDAIIMYQNTRTYKISNFPIRHELLSINNHTMCLEGTFILPAFASECKIENIVYINGKKCMLEYVERNDNKHFFDSPYIHEMGYRLTFKLKGEAFEFEFANVINGHVCKKNNVEFMNLFPIDKLFANQYYYQNGYAVTFSENKLICRKCSRKDRALLEEKYIEEIKQENTEEIKKIIALRKYYWNHIAENPKPVFLLSDRPDRAGDNGEALFRYICSTHGTEVESYFVLSKESDEYDELKKIGNIIEPFSDEHIKIHMIADYNISSQMNEAVINPFNDNYKYFRDISRKAKFIFLQHGVIHNFHGKTIGRYGRDYAGFITSAEAEREYLLDQRYGYSENQMWLTGLPRWDRLLNHEKNIITIMPTWRKFLTDRVFDETANTKIWKVKETFTESEYFIFYNSLISDERLLNTAKEYGYKICFMPHVNFLKHSNDFTKNEYVEIYDYEKSYREIFEESKLIVTDYSSVAFDFAYLRKPVVYAQFDKERFFNNHTVKKGYFDFERDGFGDIASDYESIVKILIEYIKNDCRLKDQYRKRIDKFFSISDKNCCKRVFDRISNLK